MNAARFELAATPARPGDDTAVPVVQVLGEVDVTNADALQHDLEQMSADYLIVDLSRVLYFDSAGFAVLDNLLSVRRLAVVVSLEGVVRTAMTLLHLPFHDTVKAARESLQSA